jgi:pyruvate,water dikinase
VVGRLEEAAALERGDIAVAPMMGPAWTSILRVAGAVVTEKGGILDHFAILAREAGVPAVAGAEGAVEALRRIERATVDGTRGTVAW